MESHLDWHQAKALLDWHLELGVTEAICDTPINRFELAEKSPQTVAQKTNAAPKIAEPDPVALAQEAAKKAQNLDELQTAMDAFELCHLKRGARNLVFADGKPDANIMIIGESPGRDEDMQGRPFVGQTGQLLDRMFAAIGMARDHVDLERAVYVAPVIPWRPPQNRDPSQAELDMMVPFLRRHVELAAPQVVIAMGNISCQAVLGQKGVTRLRGTWTTAWGFDVLPMLHPAFLLRNPLAKRDAWADLLSLKQKLGI